MPRANAERNFPIVFLVDVDNTLLDNDRIQDDLKRHIGRQFGLECRDRFWAIQEELFKELGYKDYLGALQRFRVVSYPSADVTVERISNLLLYGLHDLLGGSRLPAQPGKT